MLFITAIRLRPRASKCWDCQRTIATVISGNKTSQQVRERLKKEVAEMRSQLPGFRPGLVVLQVGDREDSNLYISMKLKAAADIGINANHIRLPKTATVDEVLWNIEAVNDNPAVHGIIVQLPLDSINPIDTEKVTNAVSPEKDVDGLTSINAGRLARGDLRSCIIPCTPNGCMELIKQTGVSVSGKNAVVIGRSKIVGAPMHDLLLWNHATVTSCHSKTPDLAAQVGKADILVVGAGHAGLVKGEWVKEGSVVIDCGINHIPDSAKPGGTRVVGDVQYLSAKERAGYITPVPGGVGPMTVVMLMENTVKSAKQFLQMYMPRKWNISYTKLKPLKPQSRNPIGLLAKEVGLFSNEVEPYGRNSVKVQVDVLKRLDKQPGGKYVLVTGITPTSLSEDKRTVTLGLAQALGAHLNINAFASIQQSSPQSCFGIKGGGGYSHIIPMEEVSLQPPGDTEAVSEASSLVVDTIDAYFHYQAKYSEKVLFDHLVPFRDGQQSFSPSQINRLQKLGIEKSDPSTLTHEEMSRFVRLDIKPETKVDIATLRNEIMAVLSLSSSVEDMRDRLARIVVATSRHHEPINTEDLGVSGVLALLLDSALKPNLVQTLEGTPVFVHTSHSADSAYSSASVVADKIALKLVGPQGFVVTETAHGANTGLETFFNIRCRTSSLQPNVVVLVANVRALKMYGGGPGVTAGFPLPKQYSEENLELLEKGCAHLKRQVESARAYGLPVVLAVNTFSFDTKAELELVCSQARQAGVLDAVLCTNWSDGGAGALALAQTVQRAAELPSPFHSLCDLQLPAIRRIQKVAQKVYGVKDVELLPKAKEKLALYTKQGFGNFPVCIATTHLPLSKDPELKGVSTDFIMPITDIHAFVGAGFLSILAVTENDCAEDLTRPWFHGNTNLYSTSQ
ncbi:C-1-tetrahydrofolate synthase, cytoplasmic [Hoplias malabaricus]|uniref:C-1-tetrahydrofolate synthase, cytoplasmic n=1 Tax=Hoplias malabaricus TaxID=27720 RepID=UPI0034638100